MLQAGDTTDDTGQETSPDTISLGKVVRELLLTAAVSVAAFFAIHSSIENFRVDGPSMAPTLVHEQHLIANKLLHARINQGPLISMLPFLSGVRDGAPVYVFHPPEHGDVVVVVFPEDPTRDVVKRVIGLPGDVIEIDSGEVIRNGVKLVEPYVVHRDIGTFGPIEVPDNSYYVLGDNRLVSSDSRHWGFISDDHIIGRVWYSYWPLDRIEFLHAPW